MKLTAKFLLVEKRLFFVIIVIDRGSGNEIKTGLMR